MNKRNSKVTAVNIVTFVCVACLFASLAAAYYYFGSKASRKEVPSLTSSTVGGDGTCNPAGDLCACACNGITTFCNLSTRTCMTGLCDGVNDVSEGWKTGKECSNNAAGECYAVGVIVCDGPYATRCNAPIKSPSVEICDGKDNNCNGIADDQLSDCRPPLK